MHWSIDIINAVFGGQGRTAILRLLAAQTSPLTGREVAQLTGLSPAGAARALEHLAGLGIVTRRRVGQAVTHELQRDNVLVQSIVLPALSAEQGIAEDLRSALRDAFSEVAVSVVLYGSIAAGQAHPGSDIDVLVVTANQADAARAAAVADEAGPGFFRRYGMPLSVVVQSRHSLPTRATGFLASARDSGELIAGRSLRDLMPDASE